MNYFIKVVSYIAAGCAILALNAWFIRRTINAFSPGRLPSIIAPFEIVGQEDKEGIKSSAFARLLLSELYRIQDEIATFNHALYGTSRSLVTDQGAYENSPRVKIIELPRRVFEPVEVEMKVGGVEVGGVLSWLHKVVSEDDSLRISVYYEADKTTAVGSVNRGGTKRLWINRVGSSDEKKLIRGIAYDITYKLLVDRQPQIGALNREEFEQLLTTLGELVNLNRKIALGRRPTKKNYAMHFKTLHNLVEQTPRWKELIRITAQTAENAGDFVAAINHYRNELKLIEEEGASNNELKNKISTLSAQLVKSLQPQLDLEPIRKMVGADFDQETKRPRIGILGGVPSPGLLRKPYIKIIEDVSQQQTDSVMSEYISSLVSTVGAVAPDSEFIFAPVESVKGRIKTAPLLRSLARLAEEEVNVILIALTIDQPGATELWADAINSLADLGILTVISAGNEGKKPIVFEGSPLLDKVLIAASVDRKGLRSDFSQSGNKVFWAPGEDIPVQISKDKTITQKGTGYSAAISAGVAARFMSEYPDLTIDKVVEFLRSGSTPVAPSNDPPIINLRASLQKAKINITNQKSK